MLLLKQSTAVVIQFGPFLDKTDGITLKADATAITDIDHASTGIFLSKNGGSAAIRHASVTASVAGSYGMMKVTLDTTDTNTLGTLNIAFAKAATYLPVWMDCMVVTANIWDSLFGADLLQVDVAQLLGTAWLTPGTAGTPDVNVKLISGDATSADNLEAFTDGTGYAGGTIKLDSNVVNWKGSAAPAMTGDAYANLANGGFTDLLIDGIISELAKVPKSDSTVSFNTTAINAITAGLTGATLAELSQAQPSATPTVAQAIMLLYMALRNAGTLTAATGVQTVTNDAGTVIAKATLSDDGDVFTKAKLVSGA